MSNGPENNLTSDDAFGIMCTHIREKVSEGTDFSTFEFNCKLEVHNGLITDAYLGQQTEGGFIITEHFRRS